MRKLHLFVLAIAMSVLVACSGEGQKSYDPVKCEQLKAKIEKNEKFTEEDYNDMIDQMVVIAKDIKATSESAKGDKEKEKELRKDKEFTKKAEYCIGFAFHLSAKKNDLPASTLKKLIDVQDEMKALKDM